MALRAHSFSGFTLLELVLVLAVLAIALLAVAPNLSSLAGGRAADDAAARFVALTRLARSQAITDGAVYRITIDTAAAKWWLSLDEGEEGPEAGSQFAQPYAAGNNVRLETDAPVIDGQHVIMFEPNGRTDPALVRFVGENKTVEVTCDAPMDEFHIVTEARR